MTLKGTTMALKQKKILRVEIDIVDGAVSVAAARERVDVIESGQVIATGHWIPRDLDAGELTDVFGKANGRLAASVAADHDAEKRNLRLALEKSQMETAAAEAKVRSIDENLSDARSKLAELRKKHPE